MFAPWRTNRPGRFKAKETDRNPIRKPTSFDIKNNDIENGKNENQQPTGKPTSFGIENNDIENGKNENQQALA